MDEVETLIKNRELIDDIDKDDVENPQLVVEYVNEIYAYLRQLEVKQEIRPNYLKSKKVEKTTILPKVNTSTYIYFMKVVTISQNYQMMINLYLHVRLIYLM